MNVNTVVQVFGMYLGMKLHFDSETFIYTDSFYERYDENSLNNRKRDIDLFISLADQYDGRMDELKERLITLFLTSKKGYIVDLFGRNEKFEKLHFERTRNISNLMNVISNDCTDLCDYMEDHGYNLNNMLEFNGDRPLLVKKMKLSNEFIAMLDSRFDFLKQESDNPLWSKRKFALQKYKSLIPTSDKIENLFDILSHK